MSMEDRPRSVRRTREELYLEVWSQPMNRLGPNYGLSGNGLAKICKRLDIPYPPRGYWAKKATGKKVVQTPLPPAQISTQTEVEIRPSTGQSADEKPPSDIVKRAAQALEAVPVIAVPKRLVHPHPIVASWLEEHEIRRREARTNRGEFSVHWDPGPFTETDRRRHRIAHALFMTLQRHDAVVNQTDRGELCATRDGESIIFVLRERHKQIRRPLSEDEKRWGFYSDRGWRQELQPTGILTLDFKTYMPPGLRKPWTESERRPFELILGEIVLTFLSAWPLLQEQTRERERQEKLRQEEEARRYEEERRRKRDENRWRRLVQLAQQSADAQAVALFLRQLEVRDDETSNLIGDRTLADWLEWASASARRRDPINMAPGQIFGQLERITEYSHMG